NTHNVAAYDHPKQAVIDLNHGTVYLASLRDSTNDVSLEGFTKGGIESIRDFTGIDLGASGPLVNVNEENPSNEKVRTLFYQLFSDANTHSPAYDHPRQAT